MLMYLLGSLVTGAVLLGALIYVAHAFFNWLDEDEGAEEAFEAFMKRLLFPPKEKKPEEPAVAEAGSEPVEKEVF